MSKRQKELEEKLDSEGLTDAENAELIVLQEHDKGEQRLTIELDTSTELKALRKELEDTKLERNDYKQKLEIQAERAFNERLQAVKKRGFQGSITNPEELMQAEAELNMQPSRATGQTPLSSKQMGEDEDKQYFASKTEALAYLEKQAKEGNKEAERQLREAWRREERQSGTFEFEGGLKDLLKGKGDWKKLGKRDKEDE